MHARKRRPAPVCGHGPRRRMCHHEPPGIVRRSARNPADRHGRNVGAKTQHIKPGSGPATTHRVGFVLEGRRSVQGPAWRPQLGSCSSTGQHVDCRVSLRAVVHVPRFTFALSV